MGNPARKEVNAEGEDVTDCTEGRKIVKQAND